MCYFGAIHYSKVECKRGSHSKPVYAPQERVRCLLQGGESGPATVSSSTETKNRQIC